MFFIATTDLYRQQPDDSPETQARRPAAAITAWKFTDVSVQAKVIEPRDSFPAWFWDYDNDGWPDIFVSGWRAANAVADVAADYLDSRLRVKRPAFIEIIETARSLTWPPPPG